MRGGKSHRAATDYSYLKRKSFLSSSFIDIDGMFRLGSKLLGEKTLESTNGNGTVNLAAAAGGLARMRAHSSADAGQRIGIARDSISFLEAPLGDQADIAASVGVCRTSHHAGKVGIQPIPIHFFVFVAFEHDGGS